MPDLGEVQARAEIEREVEEKYRALAETERAADRDKAILAVGISSAVALAVALPMLALVAGVSLRLFRWAAGW